LVFVFWFCAFVIAYVYAGYPALLALNLFGRKRPREHTQRDSARVDDTPLISVIVAAHNEEAVIETKIRNVLASDYPREQLEILIGSDGSSDRTEEIVRRYEANGVGLVSFPSQQGKSAIQNGLVALASGSILVFTDADCTFGVTALRTIVDDFRDPAVGLVTAIPRYGNSGETAVTQNESLYLRYESWLRTEESARGLLAMASGSLFALRRGLWQPLDRNLGDDFELPLRTALAGCVCIADPQLVSITRLDQSTGESLFRLKTRIISKDFRALLAYCGILNPFRHGGVSLSLWSHKLLRWLVPCFLIGLAFSNCFLLRAPFYRATFAAQVVCYALALIGVFTKRERMPAILSVPFSFCLVNAAALVGVWRCVSGRTSGQWTPVRNERATVERASSLSDAR
jgi:cellulose synthase/poly-beta-1,6-N-acetylglucosamine synthase-like glycosyltransferase